MDTRCSPKDLASSGRARGSGDSDMRRRSGGRVVAGDLGHACESGVADRRELRQ